MFRLTSVALLSLLVGACWLVASLLDWDPTGALGGLGMVLLGVVFLRWFRIERRRGLALRD